ncbi:DNA-methyltransferase [Brachyspira aalborgi]|jgi:DNA modification methylase|uniref:Methyltransferase n=2 Tax=Brachyspira aalborgi TaxID=29522 RepID=A0ABY3KBA3_9SPIR|nr:site-specific DNA-methyltransferase [Brachyspira aalborgi]MBS4764315.1 site-specific DNA-methyltransferase [Brachyspira sp.]TXJ34029.1 site-specific DNA-methyltransferase [Brachyspira aalborgi]TXJ43670.1 site-specific DNA-methyltransferase [Brachyspira aalborgi]CCY77747.1 dNA (Cytosine-5-)-methyltransferase [Brachyspira sp. CAG:700]
MQEYKTLKIENIYNIDDINKALPLLSSSGIDTLTDKTNIILNFDTVDIKLLENIKYNPLIQKTIEELYKIRSFSSSNGKIVFKSFNKDKRVKNKKENGKKRLAYEYYKKEFSKTNNELNKKFINKIHCADSLDIIKKFPDNCIDIVLTSPPYNFGINYENTNDVNIWEDYFNKLFNIFRECVRVLKDSGRIIINVQPMFSDYIPTHHLISNFFLKEGLIWKGEIIWEKNNYNCKYCTWGSWKSPSSPYLKYSWEFVEIFCKNSLKKEGDKNNIDIDSEEFKKWVYGKWSIAPERNMKKYKHDAMFPEELVKRLLKLFSYKNDIVLDPFNGAGTTTKVAKQLNRKFIGIDISEEYCKTAEDRLNDCFNMSKKEKDLFNS